MSRRTEQPLNPLMPSEETEPAFLSLAGSLHRTDGEVPDSVFSANTGVPDSASSSFRPEADWLFGENTDASDAFGAPLRKAGSDDEVFGPQVRTGFSAVPDDPPLRQPGSGYNPLLLDGMLFLIFFSFLSLCYWYRNAIGLLFRSLTIPGQFGQLIDEQNVSFRNFVRNARVMGFLSLTAIAFRGCLIWAGMPDSSFPEHFMPYLLPLLGACLLAVLGYKRLAYGIISLLSKRKDKVENIRTFNRVFFTASALIFTPVALVCTLAEPDRGEFFFVIQAIVLIVLALYYVGKSFSFFVSRKIPILQWILYLCAVEIWPVSFFVLFAGRGFEW